jgi:hypothetical protein
MRFQADTFLARINASITSLLSLDANAPVRTGGASLQLNQAYYCWDLFNQGRLAARAGSFYISSHLSWHYAGFQHEIDHLNGVLFIDHLSRLKRERVTKKFQKAARLRELGSEPEEE